MKKIPLRCKGEKLVPIEKVQAFQGNLKELDKKAFKQLRALIVKLGWIAPVFVWKDKQGVYNLLDGHQRMFVIRKMIADEKFVFEHVPINVIDATNKKEAAETLLAIDSRFAKITDEGLYGFVHEFDIPEDILEDFCFPEMGLSLFEDIDYDEAWEGMPEFDQKDKTAFQSIHIHFKNQDGVDKFAELIGQAITEKTRFLWYPEIEIEKYADKRY